MKDRVLVIDDDNDLIDFLVEIITDHGYNVTCAISVEDAHQIFATHGYPKFECILSDFHLPGQTGLELVTQCQQAGELIPIMILTGFGDKKLADEAIDRGAFDFLTKPVTTSELMRAINRACIFGHSWTTHRPQALKYFAAGNNSPKRRQLLTQLICTGNAELISRFFGASAQGVIAS